MKSDCGIEISDLKLVENEWLLGGSKLKNKKVACGKCLLHQKRNFFVCQARVVVSVLFYVRISRKRRLAKKLFSTENAK